MSNAYVMYRRAGFVIRTKSLIFKMFNYEIIEILIYMYAFCSRLYCIA